MSWRELVSADGRLAATLAGEAEAKHGAPLLVCVHGGGCSARYFDLKGFSVLERALARGLPVLLVNRPGHGGSPPARTAQPIEEAAALVPPLIDEVAGGRAAVVIGHSIGGAVTLLLAAQQGAVGPVRAVAVSGIGDRIAQPFKAAWADLLTGKGAEPTTAFFFGPEGTYRWNAPAALRKASESWQLDEAQDVVLGWPKRFAGVAARVRLPVHLRLAEHERIWETGPQAVARMAAAMPTAPAVDAGVLPQGGHLYELHKRGGEHVEAQLDFLLRENRR